MTPSQQTIQKIKEAIANGTLEDAERALEEYVCKAFEWVNETNWAEKDTWGKHDPPSVPTMKTLYQLFNQSPK